MPGKSAGELELVVEDIKANDLAIAYFNKEKLVELSEQITELSKCTVTVSLRKTEGKEATRELRKDWDLSKIVFDDIEMHA